MTTAQHYRLIRTSDLDTDYALRQAQENRAAVEELIKEGVEKPLLRLQQVARSVATKNWGFNVLFPDKEMEFPVEHPLGEELDWVLREFRIKALDDDAITIESIDYAHGYSKWHANAQEALTEYRIPVDYLSMSDRDVARIVRKAVQDARLTHDLRLKALAEVREALERVERQKEELARAEEELRQARIEARESRRRAG